MRIVLSNIGTMGDINPLVALALELKRRGHEPVLAAPAVYGPKIAPLGIEFAPVRPDIDPSNTALAAMIYDVRKGTERGLREFLFPVLTDTYSDLLAAATVPARADLLLVGELNYAGPIVAAVTGLPGASYLRAPISFFSAYEPPVLPMYPRLAKADRTVPGMGHVIQRLARFISRKWPQPIYDLRQSLGLADDQILRDPAFGKHMGIYVYQRDFLLRYGALEVPVMERCESLEQLRALELGLSIEAGVIDAAPISVDTAADLEAARQYAKGQKL